MPKLITPEELDEMLEDMGSMALHLCSADDLLATIQAGHQAQARVAELEALHRTYYNQPFAEACIKAASDERARCIEAAFGWWARTENLDYLATDDAHQGIADALTPKN